MPTFETLILFSVAAVVITLVPGPSMLYVVSRSIAYGKSAGIWSAIGLATGLFIHTLSAALGLSAIFQHFPIVFSVIQYLGAVYLVYLGIHLLFKSSLSLSQSTFQPQDRLHFYRQGVITELLNPKTALFFMSFLPQFVDPLQGPSATQMMVLGGILVFTAFLGDLLIALTGGIISQSITEHPLLCRIQNWIAGTVLIALGLRLAFHKR